MKRYVYCDGVSMKIRSEYVRRELEKLGVRPKPKRDPLVKRTQKKPDAPQQEPGYYGAMMHIRIVRRGDPRSATWFDVRDAYLAGYKIGFAAGASDNGDVAR